jgi:hypothetical protein
LLQEYFQDPDGVKSSGRLIAAYLVVVGVLAFPAGLVIPGQEKYVAEFSDRCFFYAAVFYGSTKGYDTFNSLKGKVLSFFATKGAAPAVPENTGAPTGVNTTES